MSEATVEAVVVFDRQKVWEALDEIDSTGELYDPGPDLGEGSAVPALLEHLRKEALVEYDEIDDVYFISQLGWKVYEQGPEGTR